ncbi:NAD(P)-dependent oxidoreductase [Acrocarpospora macrocephala]|uniref:3-hydroxyisobutyrate dehydrogenase n=1 Tax=Acrocarpospora macrocephala TaxID=150177 RepID=A0A5M3WXX8_9ACTN|nr:NAD(P)-dependent oxidoreductase [Acrocarpospora macrocephala]GES13256.1 3-hydroxyisobutyrate dehydrogenase [Acrocarpospora macrocephala]
MSESKKIEVGWVGVGRMGAAMVGRLLSAGYPVTVWNRTPEKAEPLRAAGARVAAEPAETVACPVTVTSLATPAALEEVVIGRLLAARPSVLVDTSTVSMESSRRVREAAAEAGVPFLSAPVSGNPSVVEAGDASFVCSGSREAYEQARGVLETIARTATYVGAADEARLLKICHNLLLAVMTQGLAEVVVLCEGLGVDRGLLLDFLNESVLGSAFTRYKTDAIRRLDLTPTFTTRLLLKDVDLGLGEATAGQVPLPLVAMVRTLLVAAIAQGHGEEDFLSLLAVQAQAAGLDLARK